MLNRFYDKFIFTNALKYKHGNFFLINMPFLIIPTELLVSLSAKDDEELGKEIYYLIKDATRKNLLKQFDLDFGLKGGQAVKFIEEFFSASGWGEIKNIDLNIPKKQAIVQVKNSPIAFPLHGKVKHEADHILRGVFAGLFSKIFKTGVECVELRCAALNRDECEFIIKEQKHFDLKKKQVLRQLALKL